MKNKEVGGISIQYANILKIQTDSNEKKNVFLINFAKFRKLEIKFSELKAFVA